MIEVVCYLAAFGDAQPDWRHAELVVWSVFPVVRQEGVEVVFGHPVRCTTHVEGISRVKGYSGDVGHG